MSTLLAGVVFTLLTGPVKQIAPLYVHAPWLNDPYDTIISFAMFFVPFVAAYCVVRVLPCLKTEVLPRARVRDLLRGCRVVLWCIALTLASEWVAVAIRGNRSRWDGVTWLQVGFLASICVLSVRAALALRRSSRSLGRQAVNTASAPDLLSDLALLVTKLVRWAGPLGRPVLSVLDCTERRVFVVVRRHPVWTALVTCAGTAAAVMVNQGAREGYNAGTTLTAVFLLGAGMFALVVGAGSYLGFVRSNKGRLSGARRRALDAAVLTSGGILVPFAFRYHLWWVVGSHNATAGLGQLFELLAISAVVIFTVIVVAESLLGLHAATCSPPAQATFR